VHSAEEFAILQAAIVVSFFGEKKKKDTTFPFSL